MSTISQANSISLHRLYAEFRNQGVSPVFATHCCGRIFLGDQPAVKCRTCDKHPKNVEILSETDLDNL